MKVNSETGWIEGLSNAELQRLSEAFLSVADLQHEADRNIAAWIDQYRNSKRLMTECRAKHGYDEWGASVRKAPVSSAKLIALLDDPANASVVNEKGGGRHS